MSSTPDLPIAISLIGGRYFLFSADTVSYLRREHHICGVLIGSIPQIPQQNVFLGLPLELMPEEAQLLVVKNVAYVVDDASAHTDGLRKLETSQRREYLSNLRQAGEKAAKSQADVRDQKKELALKKRGGLMPKSNGIKSDDVIGVNGVPEGDDTIINAPLSDQIDELFTPPNPATHFTRNKASPKDAPQPATLALTPATSDSLLPRPSHPPGSLTSPIPVPKSYPLFAHLHSRGYFLSPGLRFGCQYVVYPGDPLRFHSHFLAVGIEWEQEMDLMEIVGGGRLGTGVKKGFLIGGVKPDVKQRVVVEGEEEEAEGEESKGESVRTFSVEWAVM
jgi:tRNA-splicing endonuclease subunit Sen34